MRLGVTFVAQFARKSGLAKAELAQPEKIGKKGFRQDFLSVWTLADGEWRAAASGLKPLHLLRASLPNCFRIWKLVKHCNHGG